MLANNAEQISFLCSSWLAFATEGTGFAKQFPGLTMHVLTLTTNLRMPFMREYLLLHGLSDVSRQTCTKILKRWHLLFTACAYLCINTCMTLMCCYAASPQSC